MSRCSKLALLLCVVALSIPAVADDEKKDGKPAAKKPALIGLWKIESAKRNGEDFDRPVGDKVQFAGEKMTVMIAARDTTQEMKFKANTSVTPNQLDVVAMQGGAEQKVLAVFEVKGDTLKLCMSRPGGERPTKLASAEGTNTVSVVAKRVKSDKKNDEKK